ncbi:MAG: CoA-binding protein, partial [Rhodobacteraceae bacterium]|nr:CoA-binding protein [Paracoccaceae bacterium]
MLRPRHVAAVGGAWARNVVQSCLNSGFDGQVWPVHNLRSSVMGIRCFKSVADLPCPPDCTFIGVNRTATIDVVLELRRMGAGGAICFASGFAESYAEDEQGEDLQKALKEAAGDMPVLGPNCYGLINYLDNAPIWPDVHGGIRRERGVALVCQSSNIALNLTMQSRGLPLAYVVTVGNQAVVSQAAIASSLLDDSRVTAIGLYVEGFGDIREYASLARRARARRVPVVVLKAGVSGPTRSLTMSHTSSLAGSPEASRALLKRLDFGQVNSVTELVETLKLLHLFGPLPGRNLGAMSCSGGEACLMADSACHADVRFPSLHEKQSDALRSTLGPMVHLSNPLDYHTYLWGRQQALQDVFHAMMLGSYDLTCLVIDFPRADRCRYPSWKPAIHALRGASEETGSRAAVVATLHENLPEDWSEDLMNMGIVPFHGIGDALRAAAVAADIGVGWGSKKLPISTALAKHGDRRRTLMDIEARDEFAGTELKFPQVLFARDCRELEE